MKKLAIVLLSFLFSLNATAAEYATFDSFYSPSGWGPGTWAMIIGGSIAAGVLAFYTGGASIPAWISTVGGWIGSTAGLSGAAATSYGLALLGGGSIAAGGLGIAGGTAVLVCAASFSTDMAISYATDTALEAWDQKKFLEANKNMLTLPIPQNDNGGDAYKATFDLLKGKYDTEKNLDDPFNQQVLKEAIACLQAELEKEEETDLDYCTKNSTLFALLYFQTYDYQNATKHAEDAISYAQQSDNKASLPKFIWAISQIALDDSKAQQFQIVSYLNDAFTQEDDNKMIPLMTGCAMDRMMYIFHRRPSDTNNLGYLLKFLEHQDLDEKVASQALNIYAMRCLVELKRNKKDVHICAKDTMFMNNWSIIEQLLLKVVRQKDLLELMQKELLPQIAAHKDDWPEDSEINADMMEKLLEEYSNDLPRLRATILELAPGWLDLQQHKSNQLNPHFRDLLALQDNRGDINAQNVKMFLTLVQKRNTSQDHTAITLSMFTMRCLVELNCNQDEIKQLMKTPDWQEDTQARETIDKILIRHESLLKLMKSNLLPQISEIRNTWTLNSLISVEDLNERLQKQQKLISEVREQLEKPKPSGWFDWLF